MLKKFDQDGDGYVDFNEFQQLWQFVAPVSTPADSASASSSSGPARASTRSVQPEPEPQAFGVVPVITGVPVDGNPGQK